MAADSGWSCARQDAAPTNQTPDTTITDAELAQLIVGYAVICRNPAGKYRRRILLSLHAAQASVERARARGQVATLTLCHLVPVIGGDLDE